MPAIDLDNVLLTPSVTARSPLDRMVFTSRNQRRVPLQFYRANLTGACEIPLGSSAQILIKRQGDFSSEAALARALTWEKEGQGAAAVYWFLLDLNTNEMNSIFLGEAEMRTDLIFEVTLQIEGRTYTPPRVLCTVWRRYLAGNEGQPTPANPDWPLPSEVVTDAPQDGKAYVRQDGGWVEAAEIPEPTLPSYYLRAASFEAVPGRNYACDTSPLLDVPAVMPTLAVAGLVFTGDAWDKATYIYSNDYGTGGGQGFEYTGGGELSVYYSGGETTLQDVVNLFPVEGVSCALAPGANGADLFPGASGALSGGSAASQTPIAFEVELPAAPSTGDVVGFADARGTWGSNPLVLRRHGKRIESVEADFTNNAAGTFFSMVFVDEVQGWRVLASGTKPMNLVLPGISGGWRQTATTGEWTGSPSSFAYQWQHSADGVTGWADVAGATGRNFTPKDYVGEYIRVAVIATNANGPSARAFSVASGEIPAAPVLPNVADALLWFDAADESTLFDAVSGGTAVVADGEVARWEDKSGNANHVTQVTAGARPILKEDMLNGLPGLLFDGVNDRLLGVLEIADPVTVCVVFRPDAETEIGTLIESGNMTLYHWNGQRMRVYNGDNLTSVSMVALHAPCLVTAVVNTTNSEIRLNGASDKTGSAGSGVGDNGGLSLMSWKGGSQYSKGYLFEMAVFDGVLTQEEIGDVEGYLMTKWGLE